MYFFRCCNQKYPCRKNGPSACKTVEVPPQPNPSVLLKSVSAGGIIITGFAGTENEYDLIAMSLDIPPQNNTAVALNFACNLSLLSSVADIRFQLVKSGTNQMIPLASPAIYRRTLEFSGSDTIFFTVCDSIPVQQDSWHYMIKMYITGRVPAEGMVAVTNPVLTAVFYEETVVA